MSVELQTLEGKLNDALRRIDSLERQVEELKQSPPRWKHLIARPHRWRRQLSLKDRRMTVGQLVGQIQANHMTLEEACDNFDLPTEAIGEALAYFEENKALILHEAAEERRRLKEQGIPLEPQDLSR